MAARYPDPGKDYVPSFDVSSPVTVLSRRRSPDPNKPALWFGLPIQPEGMDRPISELEWDGFHGEDSDYILGGD
jgi:hypothetical protein